tara:strand:+ start:698 stop:2179 length:1482 start_codon:yes stop_codon:yes gene_type:complete
MKCDFNIDSEINIERPLICLAVEGEEIKLENSQLSGLLKKLATENQFSGKKGQSLVLNVVEGDGYRRVVLIGLGPVEKISSSMLRNVAGDLGRLLTRHNINDSQILMVDRPNIDKEPDSVIESIVVGVILGLYKFTEWKSPKKDSTEDSLSFTFISDGTDKNLDAISNGLNIAKGIELARDLANAPANRMTPSDMADVATRIGSDTDLKVSILEESDMEQLGMESLLGVAKGSVQPAKLIVMEYSGDSENPGNNIGLIGKGITFDTGGISLKPPGGMESMKGDMAGGASVIGAMQIISHLQPKINVTGIVAATENMPGGNAQKPGDVVRAMNGKTIEVINTDAEGRLVLADALSYAESKGIKNVVDIATLTGAMVVTLGKVCTGYMTNSSIFGEALRKAAQSTGEKFWELPLFEEYDELIKSDVADMKNTGGRQAGSITAAKLLEKFAGEMNWIHMDIAGTSTTTQDRGSDTKGATGHPVLTLVQLVQDMCTR